MKNINEIPHVYAMCKKCSRHLLVVAYELSEKRSYVFLCDDCGKGFKVSSNYLNP